MEIRSSIEPPAKLTVTRSNIVPGYPKGYAFVLWDRVYRGGNAMFSHEDVVKLRDELTHLLEGGKQ